ncbi:MAG TPA: nuclear transport factor 2 family protein [Candidatus Polarisedimenticolaceae bacterium]|nr:nuclear transport factor 2 family protein [Candidatus Polarisedimenticolaceae bacterium]
MDAPALDAWLRAYGFAWEQRDPDAVAPLFTPDVEYRETPFTEPLRGLAELREYWAANTSIQTEVRFSHELVVLQQERAVVRWTANYTRLPSRVRAKLDGLFLLEFAADGRCRRLEEWWHRTETPASGGSVDAEQLVRDVYAAFGRGDLPFILERLTEDVLWEHPRAEEIPWGGLRRGREEVTQFFTALVSDVEFESFEPQLFLSAGDRVVVSGRERARVRATGKSYAVRWIQEFTLRDGRIAEFREHTDTATLVEALQR